MDVHASQSYKDWPELIRKASKRLRPLNSEQHGQPEQHRRHGIHRQSLVHAVSRPIPRKFQCWPKSLMMRRLFGVTITQTINYFQSGHNDGWFVVFVVRAAFRRSEIIDKPRPIGVPISVRICVDNPCRFVTNPNYVQGSSIFCTRRLEHMEHICTCYSGIRGEISWQAP